jgi:hypothetical protein
MTREGKSARGVARAAGTKLSGSVRESALAHAKTRALELVAAGRPCEAATSLAGDLQSHPELHSTLDGTRILLLIAMKNPSVCTADFVNGFT